jgi:hypothetical protein
MALLARRPIGDVAHRIDRLTCTSGRHHHPDTGEIGAAVVTTSGRHRPPPPVRVGPSRSVHHFEHGRHDHRGVGQPAGSDVTSGQTALLRRHHDDAALAEHGKVVLDRRVLPHLGVHGRAHHHRGRGGHQRRSQEIVGDPPGIPGQQIDGRRCHHDQIGALAQAGMGDGGCLVPQTDLGRLGTQRIECRPAHETGGPLGEHRGDVHAGIDQLATDLDRLVGGDPRRDPEDHEGPLAL